MRSRPFGNYFAIPCLTQGCDRQAIHGFARCPACTIAFMDGQQDAGVESPEPGRSIFDLPKSYQSILRKLRALARRGIRSETEVLEVVKNRAAIRNLELLGYIRLLKSRADGRMEVVLLSAARLPRDAMGREPEFRRSRRL